MPKLNGRVPKYRHYKPRDLAVVRIDGSDIYLGKFNSPESRRRYHQVIADSMAKKAESATESGEQRPPSSSKQPFLVKDLILAFWKGHASTYYRRKDGTQTGEADNFKLALRPLRKLFGNLPAETFGPRALKRVRERMINGKTGELKSLTLGQTVTIEFSDGRDTVAKVIVGQGQRQPQGGSILRRLFGTVQAVDPTDRTVTVKSGKGRKESTQEYTLDRNAEVILEPSLCRTTANQRVRKIVLAFRWAAAEELIPGSVPENLRSVSGLSKGRSGARESERVTSVPDSQVDAVKDFVARQVWAMIEIQRLTGSRPGEVCQMRTADIDQTALPWVFTPMRHKTEHHDIERKIFLGPQARDVVGPWLKPDHPTAFIFSPRDSVEEQRARKRAGRVSPMTPSQRARKPKRKPKRQPGLAYDTRSYAHAIHRGCRRAKVPIWGPNRLRHSCATRIRGKFSLDIARAVLGHEDVDTTSIYAERDQLMAAEAMEAVG